MTEQHKGPFQLLSSREVYRNRFIRVREDQVIRPGGQPGLFGVVEMRAGSTILALTEEQEVYLVKEYKFAIERDSLELVSGAIDEGETPLEAAQRELKEEVGLMATEWVDCGQVDPFTTVIHSPNYLFLALGVSDCGACPEEGEQLEIIKLPLADVVAMVMNGAITHGASCVLILKTARYLAERFKQ